MIRNPLLSELTPTGHHPSPARNILYEDIPEAKLSEIPPLRSITAQAHPLTGRPPAPQYSRGVKRQKGSGSGNRTQSSRRAATPPDTDTDRLAIIQTSLHQIQEYLNTLAAVNAQNNVPLPRTQAPQENPLPRASWVPPPSTATLADLLSVPHRGIKRYANLSQPQGKIKKKIKFFFQNKHSSPDDGSTNQTGLNADSQFCLPNTDNFAVDVVA